MFANAFSIQVDQWGKKNRHQLLKFSALDLQFIAIAKSKKSSKFGKKKLRTSFLKLRSAKRELAELRDATVKLICQKKIGLDFKKQHK